MFIRKYQQQQYVWATFLALVVCSSLRRRLRNWLEQSLAMESTATRAFGARKAILWLKVSQEQHSELQVVATRGDTFLIICDYMPYDTALGGGNAR